MKRPISAGCSLAPLTAGTVLAGLLTAAVVLHAAPTQAPGGGTALKPCRLKGVEHEAWCGSLARPLDPAQPQGRQITLRYAVLPALAQRKAPDPVFFFAGGPGQSATSLAGPLSRQFARIGNRRDMVFVDQRGTGQSAPLKCADDRERQPPLPLALLLDEARQSERLAACRAALQRLPHGDLRQYTTSIAMADIDAVREALGAVKINAVGVSYGTRAVLEYQRQFPQRVRRAVIDGVAPPDMVLPEAFSPDNQAALDAVFAACAKDRDCRTRHPALLAQWRQLLVSLPREVRVQHPLTGQDETVRIDRAALLGLVRAPLYAPALAAGLPAAIAEAASGRFNPLLGLGQALGGAGDMSTGMHFSVVCAEDLPRMKAGSGAAPDVVPGSDFGAVFGELYRRVCADWPRGQPPANFYTLRPASSPTLVLSGGADPVTPPRHGERVAKALGAKARHVVVAEEGHGVMQLGCVRDAVMRFISEDGDDAALKVDAGCGAGVPRPLPYVPIAPAVAPSAPAASKGEGSR
jgi:pimeloyl-ACP methyl ester carboxylesterase